MIKLFQNVPIRSVYVKDTKQRWFSAVDICSALLSCDYQTARNYWKWYKYRLQFKLRQSVTLTHQMKLEAADGKRRFTDMLDVDGILRFIMLCPSPRSEKFKAWVAKLISDGMNVLECIENAVNKAKDTVRRKIGGLFTATEKKFFNVLCDERFYDKCDLIDFLPITGSISDFDDDKDISVLIL